MYVRVPRASEKEAPPWFGRRGERTCGFLLDRATLWSQCSLSVETPVIALVKVIVQQTMEHAGDGERATTGHDTPEGQERLRLAAAKMSAAAMQGGSAEGTQVGSGAAGPGDTASPFHSLSAQTFL